MKKKEGILGNHIVGGLEVLKTLVTTSIIAIIVIYQKIMEYLLFQQGKAHSHFAVPVIFI